MTSFQQTYVGQVVHCIINGKCMFSSITIQKEVNTSKTTQISDAYAFDKLNREAKATTQQMTYSILFRISFFSMLVKLRVLDEFVICWLLLEYCSYYFPMQEMENSEYQLVKYSSNEY